MKDITAVILCGGKGTRLNNVISDRPKPMAPVAGRPFLDIIIEYLGIFGIENIVLCTGHKADFIKDYYKDKNVLFSNEDKPLGTGGALRNALGMIKSSLVFVLNGDSLAEIDLVGMRKFHAQKKASATIALSAAADAGDYGTVITDKDFKITGFMEKTGLNRPGLINSGIYLFDKKVLTLIPENTKYSLEYDLFPKLENCYGYVTKAEVFDIGTEERYKKAQKIFKKNH